MLLVTAVIAILLVGGSIGIYAYWAYKRRKRKEEAVEQIKDHRDSIIKDEVRTVLRSFNGSDPYSQEYRDKQEEIDDQWEESCKALDIIEKRFS